MDRTAADVMLAMVAMFSSGDVSDIADVVSMDYVDHQGVHDGPKLGPDGFVAVVAAARRGYAKLGVTVEDLIVGVDRAAARLHWRGERADGEIIERDTIDILRVTDGQAVEHWGARAR
jgi:ketosteroid isomerase-like protein